MTGRKQPGILKSAAHLLFVSHDLSLSGAPMMLFHAAAWCKRHGIFVAVRSLEDGPLRAKYESEGIPLTIGPLVERERESFAALARNFNCVVANTIRSSAVVRALKGEGVPIVWWLHEPASVGEHYLRGDRKLRAAMPLADVLVAPSEQTAAVYRPFTENPVKVLRNAVPDVRTPARRTEAGQRPLRFLLLASVEPRKGQDIFVKALAQLPAEVQQAAQFEIAGRILDPDFWPTFEPVAKRIRNLSVTEALGHREALAKLEAADVVVCPSRDEAMPTVTILESMSLGKALIITTVGGALEVFTEGADALLVRPDEPETLAGAIRRLIEDPSLARKLGDRARQTYETGFTIDRFGGEFRELINDAISPPALESRPSDLTVTARAENNEAASTPRILFVSHEATLTGAPIQLVHLASWLQRAGWKILVAIPERGPTQEMLAAAGVPTVVEPTLRTDLTHSWLSARCQEFDVIVANTIVSWPVVRAARAAGKPVIWYLHETLVATRLIRQIPQIEPTLHLATLLVTPTQQTARVFQGLTSTRVEVVPYGIPAPKSSPKPAEKTTTFITLASVEPRKGQDILVEAIREIPRDLAGDARFKLVGRFLEEPFADALKRNATGLENVEFTGERDHDASLKLLAQSDVLVCPSRDETMPITILEAMSLGKAVVSTNVGGIAEWLRNGSNALLVPPENPVALARALERCLTDRALVARLGSAARRTFHRHFTLEGFARRFAELLQQVQTPRLARDHSIATGYADWLRRYGAIDGIGVRRALRRLARQPLISVVLPVYNPGLQFLEAAIDSVRRQIYSNWELCIADDASTDAAVRPFLERIARADNRIKITFRDRNGHISACSNSALALASGEWCALLDQDDAFAEEALAFVALEIARHPDAGLVYSDEDKIDEAGARSTPFFKPDWNPELFLGQNYINHLGVYRSELVREIGGFREGYEGSQDYDLALRCVERLDPGQVRHIPRILYHWRTVGGSLAAVPDAKPYAREAARRAIAEFQERRHRAGRVVACPENNESHRFIHALPSPAPLVSVIVPTRDRLELLQQCVESLRSKTNYEALEIIVVDNGSREEATRAFLRKSENEGTIRVLSDPGPFNYSRLNNRAVAIARGEILLFLNNDTEAEDPGWLSEMASHLLDPGVGAVGARLWFPDGRLQHGGVVLGLGGVAGHAFSNIPRGHPGYFNRAMLQQNCSAVTGACLMVRKTLFDELGGFDEVNLGVTFNDIDFCLRLSQRGYRIVWTPYANLIHHESASRGHQRTDDDQADFLRAAAYMQKTWGAELLDDPFYNPNLSLNLPGFEIAFPPRNGARN